MSIWDWTLTAYGRPGAAEACLELQDRHGQNVPLLLWAVWAGTSDAGLLAAAVGLARQWEQTVVGPLRGVRRVLKTPTTAIEYGAREALRMDVKAVELRAERALLEALEALSRGRRGEVEPLAALKAVAAAWDPPAPRDALAVLARALG